MKEKLRVILFGLLFLIGAASLFVFQLYIQPKLNTKEAVVVTTVIPKNQVISTSDLRMARLPMEGLPEGSIVDTKEVVGKKANVDLPVGTVLTPEFVDVYDMNPGPGEVILPLPRAAIFAVNASLRAGDRVKVSLYRRQDATEEIEQQPINFDSEIRVVAARSDSGNMVRDTEEGNTNDRLTSTERIGHLELLLTVEEAAFIEEMIQMGYQVWAARVEG